MNTNKKYIVVLSGGGSKGFYALGILKAMEECNIKSQVEAIFGVSAGAMAASYRAAGRKAEEICERLISKNAFNMSNVKRPPISAIIKDEPVREMFKSDLPERIEALKMKVYIGTTDLNQGEYHLFDQGELIPILMGSVSVPVLFPPVRYQDYLLVDGGVMENFPVEQAKSYYPEKEVIGVTLSKYKKNQKVDGIISNALVSFDLVLSKNLEKNIALVDHLFYKETGLTTTDKDEEKIREVFNTGYEDALAYFTP
jgi:NTE family protein